MKKITIALLLFFCFKCYSQDNRIIGKWKAVSVDNGEIYFNIENDSIKLYDVIKEDYNEVSKIENLKEMTKLVYFSIIFNFDKNGKYQQKSDFAQFNLYYKVNKEKGVILTSDSIENLDMNFSEMGYKMKDNYLYLEINETEPATNFILKKIK